MMNSSPTLNPVPQQLQGILWSVNVNQLDLQKNKNYIINQILSLGTLKEWKWLFQTYTPHTIKDIFLRHPIKDYTAPRYYFVKNFLLDLKKQQLNPNRYVKNLPRDLR